MKWTAAVLISFLAASDAFAVGGGSEGRRSTTVVNSAVDESVSTGSSSGAATQDPLLIGAARGEKVAESALALPCSAAPGGRA